MAVTHIRRSEREYELADPPPMTNGIGGFGWFCLFAIFVVAILLVAYI